MKFIVGFVAGLLLTLTPDLIKIYDDHVMDQYQNEGCKDLPDEKKCHFNHNKWYDRYVEENPTLNKFNSYIILGEGPLYWIVTGRCSNRIFHNPSASKDSGKITMRNYFFSRCSNYMKDISDLIFQDGDKEQPFDPDMGTF